MTVEEKIKEAEIAIAKTKSLYAKRDLQKYINRLKKQNKSRP